MLIIIGGLGISTYISINLHGLGTCTRIGRNLHVQPKLWGCWMEDPTVTLMGLSILSQIWAISVKGEGWENW